MLALALTGKWHSRTRAAAGNTGVCPRAWCASVCAAANIWWEVEKPPAQSSRLGAPWARAARPWEGVLGLLCTLVHQQRMPRIGRAP